MDRHVENDTSSLTEVALELKDTVERLRAMYEITVARATAEIIRLRCRVDRAERSLEAGGYTYLEGAAAWKPPLGNEYQLKQDIKELRDALQRPDRAELQKDGKHPAPCAKFCEATAFGIDERHLKSQIESLTLDKLRLDHIEAHPEKTLRKRKKHWEFVGFTNYEYPTFSTVREAIDESMKGEKQ